MRWWIVAAVIGFSLACGGMPMESGDRVEGPPKALDCPEGTSLKGGPYPAGRDLWAGWPMLALDPADEGGFVPADEAVEVLVATEMSDVDAMWWCADDSMTPRGPFLQRIDEGEYELWVTGTLKGEQRQGELRADWVKEGRVLRPAVKGGYVEGLPHGEWWWGADPEATYEEVARGAYLKGQPDGEWVWTGENQKATAHYEEGILQGEWKQSWGTSEQTGSFKDGARDGEWTVVADGEVASTDDHGGSQAKPRPRPQPRTRVRREVRTRTR